MPRKIETLLTGIRKWFDINILAIAREFQISFLPPLMVYVAAGISPLTAIVGSFYVKERLGLSAEFLAALGFWAMLPWALKMPIGHLVDLLWKIKSAFVYLGALMIATSLIIMIALLPQRCGLSRRPCWLQLVTSYKMSLLTL